MTAAEIVAWIAAQGVDARGVCADSRRVEPGDVFIALPGRRTDGRAHIADALTRGAVAVLFVADAPSLPVPALAVPELAALSGEIAHRIYGSPSEKLWLAGVTGTNGKTSVSQWIAQAMGLFGSKCAVIGTLGSGYPDSLEPSPNTTPDAVSLQRTLADFVARGADACAMEVSSIGIDENRVSGVIFDTAVFTNLSRDHLDHHGSMEAYGETKARLFSWPGLTTVVLNLDDAFGRELARRLRGRVPTLGYTLGDEKTVPVDRLLAAKNLQLGGAGLSFTLDGVAMGAPVLGRFNAANLMAVVGALECAGHSLARIAQVLPRLSPPPGRMQAVGGRGSPLVVVDYAHTPDALEKALSTLRETAQARHGRLVCVFGCGGDRDPGKRPQMGALAEKLADRVWLTDDNPRSETSAVIIEAIRAGMMTQPEIEPDRARAIRSAVVGASNDDVILVAGKGHEPYQEIAGRRHPFSDLEQARRALEARS